MKHKYRAFATLALALGVVGVSVVAKDGCMPAMALVIGTWLIWAGAQ